MSKIAADHLTRRAYVYIRQSTLDQVHKNLESQRRQYGLADRARDLGWQNVEVIDDDLGRSGAGVKRPNDQDRRRSRSEEHTSELQSQSNLVCRLLLEKKK